VLYYVDIMYEMMMMMMMTTMMMAVCSLWDGALCLWAVW